MTRIGRFRLLRSASLLASAVLLIGTQVSHAAPSNTHAGLVINPPITGTWYNFDHQTRSVTHISVSSTSAGLYVRTFGACEPTACAWGNARLTLSGIQASTSYHFSFANVAEYLYISGPFLRVITETHFTDTSGRKDYTTSDLFYSNRITHWTNSNPSTSNLTRLTFQATSTGQGLLTAYGACHPTSCAWGTQPSGASTPPVPMYFYYNQGFARKEVVLAGDGASLQAQTFVSFTDGSGRPNYSVLEQFNYAG
jgi:hypothetical protein